MGKVVEAAPEALTAVQIALLTIYDMCKAADKRMVITGVQLLEKHGGKSGSFVACGSHTLCREMACPEGLEPPTYCLAGR